MQRKIRIVFDGKVGKVNRHERAIEAQLASFREAIEAASAGEHYAPEPEPLWQRLAAGIGGFLATLLGLLILAAIVGGLAAAARLGWELIA
jgi:hypothetical protein